jgi:serine/threonine-protein kinase
MDVMDDQKLAERLAPGTPVAGKYVVDGPLGEGGFATVYSARHREINSLRVAIKVLHTEHTYDPRIRGRFRREAETVATLNSRNIVRVMDIGELDSGQPYIVMEFIEGSPLDSLLERCGRLYPGDVARLCIDVLKALEVAHAQGIVHRDLKPANVFAVQDPGEFASAKVLDFGIAKVLAEAGGATFEAGTHTVAGNVVCTPQYAAPELLAGKTSPLVDLYALGHMMAELLEGVAPYEHLRNPLLIAAEHLRPDPVPLGAHTRESGLAEIVAKACAKLEQQRYQSAREMLDALRQAIRLIPDSGPPIDLSQPYTAFRRPGPSVTRTQPEQTGTMSVGAGNVAHTPTMSSPAQDFLSTADESTSLRKGPGLVPVALGLTLIVVLAGVGLWFILQSVSASAPETPLATAPSEPVAPTSVAAPPVVPTVGSGAAGSVAVVPPQPLVIAPVTPPVAEASGTAVIDGPEEASAATVVAPTIAPAEVAPVADPVRPRAEEPRRPVRRSITPPSAEEQPETAPTNTDSNATPENPFGNIQIRQ